MPLLKSTRQLACFRLDRFGLRLFVLYRDLDRDSIDGGAEGAHQTNRRTCANQKSSLTIHVFHLGGPRSARHVRERVRIGETAQIVPTELTYPHRHGRSELVEAGR